MGVVTQQNQELADPGMTLAQYDQIISSMYDAVLETGQLGRLLKKIRELFKANYVTLIMRAEDGTYNVPMLVSGDIAGRGDPDGEVVYLSYGDETSPFNHHEPDKVFTVQDIMTEQQWVSSTYYLMYCHPYDVFHSLGANITMADGGLLRFRISRPRSAPMFSETDREWCRLLLPHLRRCTEIHTQFDRSESLGSLYSQAIARLSVATMVLDETGAVLELNPVAQAILNSSDGLKLVGGRLEAIYPSDNRELQRVLRNAASTDSSSGESMTEAVSISRPSGQVSLGVVVESIPSQELVRGKGRPCTLVYIRDAAGKSLASTIMTKRLFNLTPAETALAMELANGLSLEEAAEALNIRRNTARAHLRSIFSKTGVRRQTELVRIMLNSVVALGGVDETRDAHCGTGSLSRNGS